MTIPRRLPSSSSSFKSLASGNGPLPSDSSVRGGSTEEDPAAVNAKIEAQLKRDTEVYRKEESRLFKILLLGQAGSGMWVVFIFSRRSGQSYLLIWIRKIHNPKKSVANDRSTLFLAHSLWVDFRMEFTPNEWEQERLGWRAIIQLNIVRQVLSIAHIADSELGGVIPSIEGNTHGVGDDVVESWISEDNSTRSWTAAMPTSIKPRPQFTEKHRNLITRLESRLSEVEHELKSRLTPHKVYYPTMTAPLVSATPFEPGEELDDDMLVRKRVVEYTFRSWRDVLDAAPQRPSSSPCTKLGPTIPGNPYSSLDMPTQVITSLREDIKSLWADADVRAVVKRRRLEIPDCIGL